MVYCSSLVGHLVSLTVTLVIVRSEMDSESYELFSDGSCTSSLDCSLNGDCVRGYCKCDVGWRGGSLNCDVLSILPTETDAGYHNSTQASWGGNAILVDGTYHLFVAQFANSCPLSYWGTNSMIIRAESASPLGPFTYKETVIPAFSHNPTIRKGFDGAYYLYMIGDGTNENPVDCTNSSSISIREKVGNDTLVGTGIYVSRAESIYGPWSPVEQIFFTDTSDLLCKGHTNPSPHFNPDGSVYLAFQAQQCDIEHHYWALVGVGKAESWKGPFTLTSPDPVTPRGYSKYHPFCVAGVDEDPFLWRSARGFHIITHGMCPTGIRQTHYKYSLDGVTWMTSPRQTYHYTVHYTDETRHTFARMERPQLEFLSRDESTGFYETPIGIFNGVCGTGEGGSDFVCVFDQMTGMTWTVARPIASS